jgi:hypothetical protein
MVMKNMYIHIAFTAYLVPQGYLCILKKME